MIFVTKGMLYWTRLRVLSDESSRFPRHFKIPRSSLEPVRGCR